MISSLPPAVIYTRPSFLCVALCILSTFSFSLSLQYRALRGNVGLYFPLQKILGIFFSGRGIGRWPAPPGPFVHTASPGPEYKRGCQGAGKPCEPGRERGRTGKKKKLFSWPAKGVRQYRLSCGGGGAVLGQRREEAPKSFFVISSPLWAFCYRKSSPPQKKTVVYPGVSARSLAL